MLTRLYIDNYRCFTNFEFKPAMFQPVFGVNGTGKSSLLEVLRGMRDLVIEGKPLSSCFPPERLTRWDTRKQQTISLEVTLNNSRFVYQLVIEHDPAGNSARIISETLWNTGVKLSLVPSLTRMTPLFSFIDGVATLYNDGGQAAATLNFDWTRSGLKLIVARQDNTLLSSFKSWLASMLFLDVVAPMVLSLSLQEQPVLQKYAVNFADWYRHLQTEDPSIVFHAGRHLQQVIDHFDQLAFFGQGVVASSHGGIHSARTLRVDFKDQAPNQRSSYAWQELSEGQQTLIVLYTVLASIPNRNQLVFLDEPDNFLSSAEVEPIIREFRQLSEDSQVQVFLSSHHPEAINQTYLDDAVILDRQAAGPTIVRPFPKLPDDEVRPADQLARGWLTHG